MTIATSGQRIRPMAPARWRGVALDASSVLALVVIGLALLGAACWLFHLDGVINTVGGAAIGKFNGLLVLILLGGAVFAGNTGSGRTIQVLLASGGLLLAGATLVEWVTALDLHIDQAVVVDWVGVSGAGVPGRMALVGAAGLSLLGVALLLPRDRRALRSLANALSLIVLALGLMSLVSWLLGVSRFTALARLGPASAQSGLGMVLLGSALVLRTHPLASRLMTSRGLDARFARVALGATVVLPIVLGTVASLLARNGQINDGADAVLVVVGTILVGGTVAMYASVLVSRHISALERALADQRAVERERRWMASIVETAGDAVHSANLEGRITSWNAAAEMLYGWTAEEAIGRDRSIIVPADRLSESFAMTERVAANEVQHIEAVRTTKDGRRFLASIAMSPIADDDGTTVGYSLIVRDITEQKKTLAALEQTRTELERSNRDLKEFASVASHDLQEPLRKIRAFSDRVVRRLGESLDTESAADLQRVQDAAARMQQLIDGLLAFSRVSSGAKPFEPVDLEAVADAVLVDLEQTIAESGGSVDLGPLPTIDADPLQMRQLFQNLIANALKFQAPGRSPVVTVRASAQSGHAADGTPRRSWTVDVSDNGIGIEPRHAERIFLPFERLHGRTEYPGTGMGLAICQRIAKRHGGSITVTGIPGTGTTFHVVLPESQSQEERIPVAA